MLQENVYNKPGPANDGRRYVLPTAGGLSVARFTFLFRSIELGV